MENIKQNGIKKWLSLIGINLGVLISLLFIIELIGHGAYFWKYRQLRIHTLKTYCQKVFEQHPYLAVRLKKNISATYNNITITTTPDGLRWTGESNGKDKIRVACLGGSTTFCTGVSDKDTWPALLQNLLGEKYAVYNFGVPGYSSAEAIIQMALLVPEKKPHFVLFYGGWNDIKNYHNPEASPDYFAHGKSQYQSMKIPIYKSLSEQLQERSGLFYLTNALHKRIRKMNRKIHSNPDPMIDSIYVRNLKTLLALCHLQEAYPILIPQVLYDDGFKGKHISREWTPFIEDDAMPKLISDFNRLMNVVCQGEDCRVIESVNYIAKEKQYFSKDAGHFSPEGCAIFAEKVAGEIKMMVFKNDSLKKN